MVEAVSTAPENEAPESDPADLSSALLSANLPSLIGVLAHMTGDNKWLTDPYRPRRARGLDDNDDGGFPPDIQEEIRRATAGVVAAVRAGVYVSPNPSPSRIAEILGVVLAEEVPEEYGPILCEELAIRTRTVKVTSPPVQVDFSVGVIGAGMSGIAAAVALHKSGIAFEVIEKNPSVGGVWHENTYPGCGVDTPAASTRIRSPPTTSGRGTSPNGMRSPSISRASPRSTASPSTFTTGARWCRPPMIARPPNGRSLCATHTAGRSSVPTAR